MKHPIYEHLTRKQIEVVGLMVDGKDDEAQKKMDHDKATRHQRYVEMGMEKKDAEETMYDKMNDMQSYLSARVAIEGLVHVDASSDEWYSDLSKKVISSIQMENFKIPFPSGVISLKRRSYLFSSDKTGFIICLLADKEMLKMIDAGKSVDEISDALAEDAAFPFVVMENEKHRTIGEHINQATSLEESTADRQMKEFYALMSALMYVAMANSSVEEYGDTVKQKKVLAKKKKGIPRHVTNMINVRQRVKKSNGGVSPVNWKSDKMWIVRGHWRNQYYSKTDEHKHKWIDPYFKGDGKVAADKVYKI